MELYAKRTFTIDTENAFKIGPHITHLEKNGHTVIKLNLGEPDFNVPLPIKTEIKNQLDQNNTHYCDPQGLKSLREAISQQIQKTRGIKVLPEQVVVFPGAKPSIGFSQQIYCDPGDEIIYPSPGFPIFESFIHYLGAKAIPLHLLEENEFTLEREQLAPLLTPKTKMIFLNFPSNPTGGVATQKQLEGIAELILSKCHPNVRIYSDEIYERIVFDNHKHYSIASIPGMEKRTIISSGFSKSYAWTGGRVGYAILPSINEAEVFKNLNINYFSCVPPYNQEGARIALENDAVDTAVNEMVQVLQSRRNSIVSALNKIPNIHCRMPNGAFYVFVNIEKACEELGVMRAFERFEESLKKKTSPSTLFQMFALYEHHDAVMDRRSFGKINVEREHYIRISYAADISILNEGVARLKNALQDRKGFDKFIQTGKHLYSS